MKKQIVLQSNTFTLIELLTVVSILSILISMLLPGLNRAREMAKNILCKSNMKQLGIAYLAYASDHGDFTVRNVISGGTDCSWTGLFAQNKYLLKKNMICPSRTRWQGDGWYDRFYKKESMGLNDMTNVGWRFPDYGINLYFASCAKTLNWEASVKLNEFKSPSRTIIFVDSAREARENVGDDPLGNLYVNYYYSSPSNGPILWPAHMGRHSANGVMADGHVDAGTGKGGSPETTAKYIYASKGNIFYSSGNLDPADGWHRHDGKNAPNK